jgi:hypothetical protein
MRKTFLFGSLSLLQLCSLTLGPEAAADNRDPGDSSPIEIAEGSPPRFHKRGGFALDPRAMQASGNQNGFTARLFALDGCTTGSCAIKISSDWSAKLYNGMTVVDSLVASGYQVTIDIQPMDNFIQDGNDSYGPGVRQAQRAAHFAYAMVTPTSGAMPTRLQCPNGATKCRMVIAYCTLSTMPPSGHPEKCG